MGQTADTELTVPTPSSCASARRSLRILAVDDDSVDLAAFRRCIQAIAGLETDLTTAQTLDEALAAEGPFDLLFIDYHLKGLGGLDVLDALRGQGCETPAVLLTGSRGEEVFRDALHAGVLDYLPKSALTTELLEQTIRASLMRVQLSEQIRDKQQKLQATVERLRRSQAEVDAFYHSVSHELKTPLTGVREFMSLLDDGAAGEITPPQKELVRAALRNCDRMVVCIHDMLDVARVETGKLVIRPTECCLGEVVRDVVKSLSGEAERKGIALSVTIDAELPTASFDASRIFQVVANLLSNALKFTPSNGRVAVAACALEGGDLRVSVADTGPGLRDGQEARIFDRLYQVHEDDSALHGGLGMGLYICREIMRLHGGSITVESTPGAGAEFSFQLPVASPSLTSV